MKTVQKDVMGKKVSVGQLGAERAVLLLHRMVSAVAPMLGNAVDGAVSMASLGTGAMSALDGLETADLGKSFVHLFNRMTGPELMAILKELLSTVMVHQPQENGEVHNLEAVPNFTQLFSGDLAFLFAVAGASLEVNYRDFWTALVAAFKKMADKAKAKAEAKKAVARASELATSAGLSGGA